MISYKQKESQGTICRKKKKKNAKLFKQLCDAHTYLRTWMNACELRANFVVVGFTTLFSILGHQRRFRHKT